MQEQRNYMNPYLAGIILGLILLATFYISGRGLGASGAVKSAIVSIVDNVTPAHAEQSLFFSKYVNKDKSPLKEWLIFEVIGVLIGGFISGLIGGRLKLKVEKGPRITSKTRIVFAIAGGLLFGLGAQLARGCTSGAALSGMAVLSTAGFLTMIFIFGTGYIAAYFFRKLWI